ncbi:MAG: DUF3082 domain-containing protein [Xenococcaceae cyanobacterium MO_188.B32]|nr:DUF3082 domain-containing protein [Xenococcaceae cyanobacterium MO_188.B32]
MNDKTTNQDSSAPSDESLNQKVTPLRCFVGSIISGGLSFALYLLFSSISQTYAAKPLVMNSALALRISVAVRTLVTGVVALGASVFAFVALGLFLLGIQLIVQGFKEGNEQ